MQVSQQRARGEEEPDGAAARSAPPWPGWPQGPSSCFSQQLVAGECPAPQAALDWLLAAWLFVS